MCYDDDGVRYNDDGVCVCVCVRSEDHKLVVIIVIVVMQSMFFSCFFVFV